MKRILITILIINLSNNMIAQCAMVANCVPAQYCTSPGINGIINHFACVGMPLSTGIKIIPNQLGQQIFMYPLTAVTGLPPGLSYNVSPSYLEYDPATSTGGGALFPNPFACIAITGTPTVAGTYNVVFTFTITHTIAGNPNMFVTRNYQMVIPSCTTTGLNSIDEAADILLSPNPVISEIAISSDTYLGKIVVMDALGKSILEIDGNYYNQKTIDVSTLKNGLYFLQANDGERIITRKFLKN